MADGTERITVTGTAQHDAWQARTVPPVERLDSGLWSVPVPIPNSPLRYTLCYLLPGDDGLVVVDPGWDTDEAWTALVDGLAAAGATPADVTGIVATHVHPDHHGLTTRLRDASGAWVAMHPAERDTLPQRTAPARTGDHLSAATGWLRRSGAPEEAIAEIIGGFAGGEARPMAEPDVLLDDGDLVPLAGRTVRAVWTPGHTPGHICLHLPDAQLMLTGDHVLPRITPSIALEPDPPSNPLADFLNSLELMRSRPDAAMLPAHGPVGMRVHERVDQLIAHHAVRLDASLAAVREGRSTAHEVADVLPWTRRATALTDLDPFNAMLATLETASHLEVLVERGVLNKTEQDGVDRYTL